VRVIAATNRDLEEDVRQGKFREDLYYRLVGATLYLPPLRERRDDLPIIAQELLKREGPRFGKPSAKLTKEALAYMQAYRWPGNVRELQNELRRMLALASGEELGAELLSPRVVHAPREESQARDLNLLAGLDGTLKQRMEQLEARVIKEVLVHHRWNKSRAAAELGLSRVGLRSKLSRYGLDQPS